MFEIDTPTMKPHYLLVIQLGKTVIIGCVSTLNKFCNGLGIESKTPNLEVVGLDSVRVLFRFTFLQPG